MPTRRDTLETVTREVLKVLSSHHLKLTDVLMVLLSAYASIVESVSHDCPEPHKDAVTAGAVAGLEAVAAALRTGTLDLLTMASDHPHVH